MTETLHVVNRERHQHKKWLRPADFKFAASIHTVPVGAAEMTSAARAFPLAFVEVDGNYELVAVFSLQPGRNLFVSPTGRWLAHYVPAALGAYPFALGRRRDGNLALCVNEDSGLVKDSAVGEVGIPFFGDDGAPSPDTLQLVDSLTTARRSLDAVNDAVAEIMKYDLLEPWPITGRDESGDRTITGIARINELALNSVGANDLLALRDCGALAIAYCQLVSMGNIMLLGRLAGAYNQARVQRMTIPPNSFMAEDDGNLKIDWDQFLKDE
jgi:hypothetical protein